MSSASVEARDRWRLGVAAFAVLVTAADTYVVVVALPSIMGGVGTGLDRLQRATPIVTGFLVGYTVVLPLIGRLADLEGPDRVFKSCLGVFAAGSVVTATAHSLPVVVAGRAVQGIGAGGLVPVALAMVAARWAPDRRGTPLGAIGAMQELGSVIGPLYGAAIVAVASWRAIFWINVPVVVILALLYRLAGEGSPGRARPGRANRRLTVLRVGAGLLVLAGSLVLAVALDSPADLATSTELGQWFAPSRDGAWAAFTTPAAFLGAGLVALSRIVRVLAGRGGDRSTTVSGDRTAVVAGTGPTRSGLLSSAIPTGFGSSAWLGVDLVGAGLLAGFLGCVIVVFSSADPSRQVLASSAPVVVPLGLALAAAFCVRQQTASTPLIPRGTLRERAAWGGMAVNLFAGAALMAALVDVPLFARGTADPNSEVGAALVLLRFLVAVPLGALAGGVLCRRRSMAAPVASTGMAVAALALAGMAGWNATALGGGPRPSDAMLVVAGFGFGLAIAPVNLAVLGAVPSSVHALASALAVVARTVGMMAGLSVLTSVALRHFYEAQSRIGSPLTLCPDHPTACPAYDHATTNALIGELHTIFGGAAICSAVAALLAIVLLRPRVTGTGRVLHSSSLPRA